MLVHFHSDLITDTGVVLPHECRFVVGLL